MYFEFNILYRLGLLLLLKIEREGRFVTLVDGEDFALLVGLFSILFLVLCLFVILVEVEVEVEERVLDRLDDPTPLAVSLL